MKHLTLVIALSMLCMSCKNENANNGDTLSKSQATQDFITNGTFKASLGDKTYEVAVRCRYLKEDYFIFDSDSSGGIKDTNGDGIIISGNQDGKVLSLIIKDHGKSYSAGNISLSKLDNKASGSGSLFLQSGGETLKVNFEVTCN